MFSRFGGSGTPDRAVHDLAHESRLDFRLHVRPFRGRSRGRKVPGLKTSPKFGISASRSSLIAGTLPRSGSAKLFMKDLMNKCRVSFTPMRARSTGRRSCSAGPFGRVQLTDAMNMTFEFFRLWTYCEIGGCLPSGVGPSTRVLRFLSSTSAKMERAQKERLYRVVRIRSIRWPFNLYSGVWIRSIRWPFTPACAVCSHPCAGSGHLS